MANTTLDKQAIQNQVLGRSFRLEQVVPGFEIGRDIAFGTGPNGKDIQWVQGIDCLGQALRNALTTALGSDVFNVNFGFDGLNALAEETDPVIMRERVRISVIKVLQRDARIRRILDVKLLDGRLDPSTGNVDSTLPVSLSRELSVVVSFEVVTGDQFTVTMGQVKSNG